MSAKTVRRAEERDIPAIAALYTELYGVLDKMSFPFALNEERIPEILAAQISSKLCLILVAETDGAVIGFLSAFISRIDRKLSCEGGLLGKIADICVTESARKGGTASMLLRAAEDWFRECGCSSLECDILCENTASRSFFRKHGYGELSVLGYKKL